MATDFDTIVAVTGLSGLYRVAANRPNGLIVEDLSTGQRKFAPARTHQFSLLASIGIYTEEGTEDLRAVFTRIRKSEAAKPETAAAEKDLRAWFKQILPEHDEDRVRISDIRKLLKWYLFLEERNLLPAEESAPAAEDPAAE